MSWFLANIPFHSVTIYPSSFAAYSFEYSLYRSKVYVNYNIHIRRKWTLMRSNGFMVISVTQIWYSSRGKELNFVVICIFLFTGPRVSTSTALQKRLFIRSSSLKSQISQQKHNKVHVKTCVLAMLKINELYYINVNCKRYATRLTKFTRPIKWIEFYSTLMWHKNMWFSFLFHCSWMHVSNQYANLEWFTHQTVNGHRGRKSHQNDPYFRAAHLITHKTTEIIYFPEVLLLKLKLSPKKNDNFTAVNVHLNAVHRNTMIRLSLFFKMYNRKMCYGGNEDWTITDEERRIWSRCTEEKNLFNSP